MRRPRSRGPPPLSLLCVWLAALLAPASARRRRRAAAVDPSSPSADVNTEEPLRYLVSDDSGSQATRVVLRKGRKEQALFVMPGFSEKPPGHEDIKLAAQFDDLPPQRKWTSCSGPDCVAPKCAAASDEGTGPTCPCTKDGWSTCTPDWGLQGDQGKWKVPLNWCDFDAPAGSGDSPGASHWTGALRLSVSSSKGPVDMEGTVQLQIERAAPPQLQLKIGDGAPEGTVQGEYCNNGRIVLRQKRLAFSLTPLEPPCPGDLASRSLWGPLEFGCELRDHDKTLGGMTCGAEGNAQPVASCGAQPVDDKLEVEGFGVALTDKALRDVEHGGDPRPKSLTLRCWASWAGAGAHPTSTTFQVLVNEPDKQKTDFACRGGERRKDDFLERQAVPVDERMAQEARTWESWRSYRRPELSHEAKDAWRTYQSNQRNGAAHNAWLLNTRLPDGSNPPAKEPGLPDGKRAPAPLLESRWWQVMARRGAPQHYRLEPGVHAKQPPLPADKVEPAPLAPTGPVLPAVFAAPGSWNVVHAPPRYTTAASDYYWRRYHNPLQ